MTVTCGRLKTLSISLGLLALAAGAAPLRAQNIQVTSATPPAAAQGTTNLNVAVGGNGFKKGATATWYITGTQDTGNVVVNSTAFNSSSQVTANITIPLDANISGYDIQVQNSDGRSGKGTALFSVTPKGTPTGCTTLGTPSGFSLASSLNYVNGSGAAQYGPGLGLSVAVRPVVITAGTSSRTVLVAAVGKSGTMTDSGQMEFFFLDPVTAQVLDGTVIVGSQIQPHLTVTYDPTMTIGIRSIQAGDFNGDGVADFLAGNWAQNIAYAFIGSEDSNGILSYSFIALQPPPSNPGSYGNSVAMGKLDSTAAGDQAVVGAAGGSGTRGSPGVVYVYSYSGTGFDLTATLTDPARTGDSFGAGAAVADVTGDGIPDLVVGAPGTAANGIGGSGEVYVYPAPLSSPGTYYGLATGVKSDAIGGEVGIGNFDGHTDVIAVANSPASVVLFDGPVSGNQQSAALRYIADPRLSTGNWGTTNADSGDMVGTGQGAFLVGVIYAVNSNSCKVEVGAAELFLPSVTNLGPPAYAFQPPLVQSNDMLFGWSVGLLPAKFGSIDLTTLPGFTPLVFAGGTQITVGSTSSAGQVYVYKQN